MKEILWVLTEALVIKKKSVVLILVKQTQNFALGLHYNADNGYLFVDMCSERNKIHKY